MLEETFLWMGEWPISKAIGESLWIFPLVQAFHLVALAAFIGAVLIVDLRLLRVALTERPVPEVARDAKPWLIWSLVALVLTGIPQLIQNASREYYSDFFWWKMYLLFAATVFTFTVRAWITRRPRATAVSAVVGLTSLSMWIGVTVLARLIGLFT